MDFFKRIAGIVLGGAVALGVIVGGISWFQMTPADRGATLGAAGRSLAWLGIVLVLPWATYFLTTAAARRDSNSAGALLVAFYTLIDAGLLAWLLGVSEHSNPAIVMMLLGVLVALAYNLLACDWIAEKLG